MKVVIVGGGFGGIRAALDLADDPNFDVTLIARQAYFEYYSALYRSATGHSPMEVAILLTDFFARYKNIVVVEDEIEKIIADAKIVTDKSGSHYSYDALILAVGSITQYFGIKGLQEYSYGIKSVQEALELKRHIHESITKDHEIEKDYVVIGGGATGVELAGELIGYLKHVRKRHGINTDFNVSLVEASPRLLPILPEKFTKKFHSRIKSLGIKLYLNTAVQSETIDELELPSGDIKSHTVIWTAGVANNPLFATHPNLFKLGKGSKAEVNEYLEGHPNIYIVGDSANTQYTGMAQTAIHNANFVANDLRRRIKSNPRKAYIPKKPIYAIPAGPYWCGVLWGNIRLYGKTGWVLRHMADLKLYLSFLPFSQAVRVWRSGFEEVETCEVCNK